MYYYGPGPTPYGVGPNNFTSPGYNQPQYGGLPGYNTGYYTNNYNMQNPYYLQQLQRQEYERQMREQVNQDNIGDRLARCTSQYSGVESSYQRVTQEYTNEQIMAIQKYNGETMKSKQIGDLYRKDKGKDYRKYINPQKMAVLQQIEEQQKQDSKAISKDVDLYEFMENGYKINIAIDERERARREANLRQMYNQNSYQQLLNMHNNIAGYRSNYDNIQPISIDDMEVSLPSHLIANEEYNRRRQQFLSDIMRKLNYNGPR